MGTVKDDSCSRSKSSLIAVQKNGINEETPPCLGGVFVTNRSFVVGVLNASPYGAKLY